MTRLFAMILGAMTLAGPATAQITGGESPIRVQVIADGFDVPWAVALLPDGAALITEKAGELVLVRDGVKQTVRGTPKVQDKGQGGLLDVMVPRDFATSRQVYLTYARRQGSGAGTAVAVGRLNPDGTRLTNLRTIFESAHGGKGGRHFGSRVVEAPDGSLFVTIGERGNRPSAQDLSTHNGSIVRITRDGGIPKDNPFVGQPGVQPHIWSFGHRNPQGADFDALGRLWIAEHGAKGGDEINQIRKGANFGWPVIAYGRHYSGAKIGEGTHKDGLEQPAYFWDPSIAPSGIVVYSGKLWPQWRGDILVGSLKFDMIARLSGATLREMARLSGPETERVRDVIEAPDGALWVLSEGQGALYRLTPGQ